MAIKAGTFEEFVQQARTERGFSAEDFARRIIKPNSNGERLAYSSLKAFERGKERISLETGESIIIALGLDAADEKRARRLLKEHVESNSRRRVLYPRTAAELQNLIDDYEISALKIPDALGVSRQAVQSWRQGIKAIPAHHFVKLADSVLPEIGVPANRIANLEEAYAYELIMVNDVFDWLPEKRRRRAAVAASRAIRLT
jgi:transcriptional regulator with XRE-family HTH domain